MSKRKNQESADDFFRTSELPTHIFRAGDVGRILDIEKWRLEKFLTGKQYKLSPSGHIGKGRGSWRLFSHQDLYRLALAKFMVNDGFTAPFVSTILEAVEDRELLEIDEHGDTTAEDICVFRGEKGPNLDAPRGSSEKPYYMIKVRDVVRDVDKRIQQYGKAA